MKMPLTNPKINLNLNKGKQRMVGDKGYWLYIFGYIYLSSASDDRDASYPDSGPIMDSKEGGKEESDEKEGEGTSEEGCL